MFKAKVAIEALKERETLSELAVRFDLDPNRISQRKQEFLANSAVVFEQKSRSFVPDTTVNVEKPYPKIGELQAGKDFLKKVWPRWDHDRHEIVN